MRNAFIANKNLQKTSHEVWPQWSVAALLAKGSERSWGDPDPAAWEEAGDGCKKVPVLVSRKTGDL